MQSFCNFSYISLKPSSFCILSQNLEVVPKYLVDSANCLSASLLKSERMCPSRGFRSFGMAKGELQYPDDIDFCNDEIAAMFTHQGCC